MSSTSRSISDSEDPSDLRKYIIWGVAFSLLVHVLLLLMFATRKPQHFESPVFVDIDLEPLPRKTTKQIVETPDSKPSVNPPENARLLSDKNTETEKESIKRGDAEAGPIVGKQLPAKPGPSAPAEKPAAQSPAQKQAPVQPRQEKSPPSQHEPHHEPPQEQPKLKLSASDLSLDSKTLVKDFVANQKSKPNDNPLDLNKMQPLSSYQPFSRPYGSGARVLGNQGTNDFLPNLPDGDITMLNAKADQYAVFVRRVATQVFTEMRSEGWEVLRGNDIRSATRFALIHATLSPKGDLLSVTLDSASGSNRFDQLVLTSARKGARDPNPPPGARASDGNIHFIFQSRSWVEGINDPRTGSPIERRWVLLGTGLE